MDLRQQQQERERQQQELWRRFRQLPPPVDVDVPRFTVPRLGLLGNVPAPEPEPTLLQRLYGFPDQVPAPKRDATTSPLRQVLGLDPIPGYDPEPAPKPDLTRGALRKVLGLDSI